MNKSYNWYFYFWTTINCHRIWIRSVNTLTTQIKKIHSYDKTNKMIVNLGSKKYEDKNNSTCQLNHLQNLLSMSIVDTPERDVSKVDRKLYKRKIRTSSIKSSSTSFSCSIRSVYNRFYSGKKVSCWSHILLGLIHQFY